MKKKIVLFILFLGLVMIPAALADNQRFADLTADSLNHVTIYTYNTAGEPESKTINDCKQIKQILDFLQGMDLTTLATSDTLYPPDRDAWLFHMTLNEHSNQVYFFENRAFVGKTVYRITPTTVEGFRSLYDKLN